MPRNPSSEYVTQYSSGTGSTPEPTPEQFDDDAAPSTPDENLAAWVAITGLTVPQLEYLAAMR